MIGVVPREIVRSGASGVLELWLEAGQYDIHKVLPSGGVLLSTGKGLVGVKRTEVRVLEKTGIGGLMEL